MYDNHYGNLYGNDDDHASFMQSGEDSSSRGTSTITGSLTNSTASLLTNEQEQQQQYIPVERDPFELLKPQAMKATTWQGFSQPWRQSMDGASTQMQAAAFVTPNSGQKLPHYTKLQYRGDIRSVKAVTSTQVSQVEPGTFYASDLETVEEKLQQKQQQQHLIPIAKSHSTASSIRRIRRPRQWVAPLKRLSRAEENAQAAKFGILLKGRAFIFEFLQGSSIHGFIYLAKIGLSIVERMIWLAFICVALFAIISLSKRTWERFQTSPMVISMDRNKLVWNTSFPSLTVCPHKRIDELKVEEYMEKHPEIFESEQDRNDFHAFIEKLARLTYENIETLPRNKTFGIPSSKYLDLLYELKWNFEPEMSSGAAVQMFIYETLTEFGICHSVNSLVARYNSYDYWKRNDWNILDHGDRVTVHPLDGEIYAQIINLSTAYDVYFHGSGDIPNISKQRYTFPETDYTTVELIALEIYTAEEARAFTTKQRKCRYQYEAEEMRTSPIYSFGLCLAECRMFFALKVCGCVPHFYRNRLKNGRVLRVCDFDGLACLEDIKREIISLKSSRYKIDCHCLSNCDDSNFFVQSHRSRVWFLGANLQWGIIDYPKMQLRRDVLFSFADVLVYIGGLIGFFLGCSALSFTEVIYYFTARLVKRLFWT
ncbi:PREDICTED: sodium channel protein Nach [Bactrocera latifrons]|uniref:sodium channel protein Nach n=1 Tax=Bactrocera latifrons TaxID=174628 RepID=UPI0008DC99A0|nr:PREDICTED: sodium channel protein Nach [Bactrocera latifrons]